MLTRRSTVPVDDVASERYETYERRSSRIPQLIGLVIGVAFMVLGIAAVARTSVNTDHIYDPHMFVWHLWQNPLMGLIEIAFGALVVLSSVQPGGTRAAQAFFGVVAFAFGLIVVLNVAPNHLYHWVAVTHRNGWLFLIAGLVLAIPALVTPNVVERRVEGERPVNRRFVRTTTAPE
ncbi:MAG TPA: DUF4383 domain-containing protein [Acidimicrobiia bacterium]|jgi:hypothetical protein